MRYIEAGSFVNPQWVPQMADSAEVFTGMARKSGVTYAALVPNLKGCERALSAGADELAVFAAASEAFSQKNINCSISDSLERFAPVVEAARLEQIPVRGYISCVLGCPYSGEVDPVLVLDIAEQLLAMGCYEISLGDTIGVGTAGSVNQLLEVLTRRIPVEQLAVHMHDTYGQALTNIYAALHLGGERGGQLGGWPWWLPLRAGRSG